MMPILSSRVIVEKRLWPILTSDDLSELSRTSNVIHDRSMVVYEHMILKEWGSFAVYPQNNKHLLIFQLTYNGRGQGAYLNLGHICRRSELNALYILTFLSSVMSLKLFAQKLCQWQPLKPFLGEVAKSDLAIWPELTWNLNLPKSSWKPKSTRTGIFISLC